MDVGIPLCVLFKLRTCYEFVLNSTSKHYFCKKVFGDCFGCDRWDKEFRQKGIVTGQYLPTLGVGLGSVISQTLLCHNCIERFENWWNNFWKASSTLLMKKSEYTTEQSHHWEKERNNFAIIIWGSRRKLNDMLPLTITLGAWAIQMFAPIDVNTKTISTTFNDIKFYGNKCILHWK